jgi:hypothetical protein
MPIEYGSLPRKLCSLEASGFCGKSIHAQQSTIGCETGGCHDICDGHSIWWKVGGIDIFGQVALHHWSIYQIVAPELNRKSLMM